MVNVREIGDGQCTAAPRVMIVQKSLAEDSASLLQRDVEGKGRRRVGSRCIIDQIAPDTGILLEDPTISMRTVGAGVVARAAWHHC